MCSARFQVSHLDARASQVDVALPLGLHTSVLGRLGVAALMSSSHSLARRQRDDAWNEANDGAHRALTPGSDAGQQVRPDGDRVSLLQTKCLSHGRTVFGLYWFCSLGNLTLV